MVFTKPFFIFTKIYLEIEKARLTRMLARIKEDEGDISGKITKINPPHMPVFLGAVYTGDFVCDFIAAKLHKILRLHVRNSLSPVVYTGNLWLQ